MQMFRICTDSSCDLSLELLSQWDVSCSELSFYFLNDGIVHKNYSVPMQDFYNTLRQGRSASTVGVNCEDHKAVFRKALDDGMDVLYLGLSSEISSTYQNAVLAMEELKEEYPQRNMIPVDTLSASVGLALLLHFAVELRDSGKSLEETAKAVLEKRLSVCHCFKVDDLNYLMRGGRVGGLSAAAGKVMNIKPVLNIDSQGRLSVISRQRGAKQTASKILEIYRNNALLPENGPVFIGHADALEDALYLETMLYARTGIKAFRFLEIGPVLGAHTGPGMVALAYFGKER